MNSGRPDLPLSQFFIGLKWFLCCFQNSPNHQHCVWKGLLLQKAPVPAAFLSLSEGFMSLTLTVTVCAFVLWLCSSCCCCDTRQCLSQTFSHWHQSVKGTGKCLALEVPHSCFSRPRSALLVI